MYQERCVHAGTHVWPAHSVHFSQTSSVLARFLELSRISLCVLAMQNYVLGEPVGQGQFGVRLPILGQARTLLDIPLTRAIRFRLLTRRRVDRMGSFTASRKFQ